MSEAQWLAPLVQGLVALASAGALFLMARFRFRRKGGQDVGGDVGLD